MHKETALQQRFIALYDELSPAIFKHCFFRISNRERALELTQEVFLKFWEKMGKEEDIRNPSAFIYRIARNLIIDEYRRKKSVSLDELEDQGFDAPIPDDEKMTSAAEISQIFKAVEKIPEKYREIITLRYVDGLSPAEIAAVVGRSENSVSVQINRGTEMLRKLLQL